MAFPDNRGANDELHCTELCTLGDLTYVAVPAGVVLPDQPPELVITPVVLTDVLKEQIKAASPHVALVYERTEAMIRAKYSMSDEAKYARIGIGALMGPSVYTLAPGEHDELLAFGVHCEVARQWGRDERAKWGL